MIKITHFFKFLIKQTYNYYNIQKILIKSVILLIYFFFPRFLRAFAAAMLTPTPGANISAITFPAP